MTSSTLIAWVLAAGLVAATAPCGAGTWQWELIHRQSDRQEGSSSQPSIRYGHSLVSLKDRLITTHGYYFDRTAFTATWLSDTWAMDAKPPHQWQRLSAGISQEQATVHYTAGSIPPAPCGRFGHGSAVYNETLLLYGGHDGGFSRHGKQNYEPGFDFDELWQLGLENPQGWSLMKPPSGAPTPGKRYLLASVVVGSTLVVYGGLAEGQGDVWGYNLQNKKGWELLSPEIPRAKGGPGRRVGHSIAAIDLGSKRPQGFLLYGGRYIEPGPNGSESQLAPEIFFFDLHSREWRLMRQAGGPAPPARKYHAEASTWISAGEGHTTWASLVAGGTITTPSLTCTPDAWAMTVDCGVREVQFTQLPDMPISIYDLRGGAGGGSFFAFGGHLCSATKGSHPFFYVNSVYKVALGSLKAPPGACRLTRAETERLGAELGSHGSEHGEL